MRGKRVQAFDSEGKFGNIPAHAGKTIITMADGMDQ